MGLGFGFMSLGAELLGWFSGALQRSEDLASMVLGKGTIATCLHKFQLR